MNIFRIQDIITRNDDELLRHHTFLQRCHIDLQLLIGILLLITIGLLILYSAADQDIHVVEQQAIKLVFALIGMVVLAQISPEKYRVWSPWLFLIGMLLLIAVLVMGHVGHGGKRWLNLGLFRFQPSELMKLALPMMLAWYFHELELPPAYKHLLVATIIIMVPALLIAKQPDLGTALLIIGAGFCVLLLTGVRWVIVGSFTLLAGAALPILWHFMRAYQRQRVLTFLNPERDPLGSGYHIIQSKIAIGSGGIFGKGWLHGTQSHLAFLPEHATDFIFAVCGEELGLIGCAALLIVYLYVVYRCLYIASIAQDTYTRLLAGSLTFTFFLSFFINIGMVIGILPVVGVPLPLVSYGGTSVVTVLASFGILMSINNHRRLLAG